MNEEKRLYFDTLKAVAFGAFGAVLFRDDPFAVELLYVSIGGGAFLLASELTRRSD